MSFEMRPSAALRMKDFCVSKDEAIQFNCIMF